MFSHTHKVVYYFCELGNETQFYEIKEYPHKTKKKYRTSFPLENSIYQYVTYFDNYSDAYNYVIKNQTKNQDCL